MDTINYLFKQLFVYQILIRKDVFFLFSFKIKILPLKSLSKNFKILQMAAALTIATVYNFSKKKN